MANFASPENSRASLYGSGVFTTIAISDGKPLLWGKHWRRLAGNAARLGLDLDEGENDLLVRLESAISTEKLMNGRARITLSDERPGELWSKETEQATLKRKWSVLLDAERPIAERFKLTTSPFPVNSRSPLAGIKSCNYLEQMLSLDEAKGRGFDEAVRLNEHGQVTSGCTSNIFWLKHNHICTPMLATGCLAGTTREYVFENIDCEEVEAEIEELVSADAIYLTSAGLGIVRVAELDGCELPDTKHPIQALWPPS